MPRKLTASSANKIRDKISKTMQDVLIIQGSLRCYFKANSRVVKQWVKLTDKVFAVGRTINAEVGKRVGQ